MKHIQFKMTWVLWLGAFCSWGWRSRTPWPLACCRTRRIILPLLGLPYVTQRSGCTVIYIPKKQVMFFETRMWASSLGATLRKGWICVASEKGEVVHWDNASAAVADSRASLAQWLKAVLWQALAKTSCKNQPLWQCVLCQKRLMF